MAAEVQGIGWARVEPVDATVRRTHLDSAVTAADLEYSVPYDARRRKYLAAVSAVRAER